MREEKSEEVTPGLRERERERREGEREKEREREREYKIIWNYQIICDIFSVFLR